MGPSHLLCPNLRQEKKLIFTLKKVDENLEFV